MISSLGANQELMNEELMISSLGANQELMNEELMRRRRRRRRRRTASTGPMSGKPRLCPTQAHRDCSYLCQSKTVLQHT